MYQQVEGLAGQAAVQSAVKSCGLRDLTDRSGPGETNLGISFLLTRQISSTDTEIRKRRPGHHPEGH